MIANGCDTVDSGLNLYDLTALQWTSVYDAPETDTTSSPTIWQVPSKVYNIIGGG